MKKKVFIIGSGFSSLSAACYLSKEGFEVHVFEKNDVIGGRARQFKSKGFTFKRQKQGISKNPLN